MQIAVIGSGSSGNGYLIKTKTSQLLIECGMRSRDMLKMANFNVVNVAGAICSHVHKDHVGYLKEYRKYGFPIYMTSESCGLTDGVVKMRRMHRHMIGEFQVIPFAVPHNGTECDGFLINHPDFGNLLFITDAEMCPYDFSKVCINHALVECNYSKDFVDREDAKSSHVFLGHMEFETCRRLARHIYSPGLKSFGLIHLSNGNADAEMFRRIIQEDLPNVDVWVAEKEKIYTWRNML